MPLTEKHHQQAQHIDNYVKNILQNGGTKEDIIATMYDYMPGFKYLMDHLSHQEIDSLSQQYDGFYHFANILEKVAQGIKQGILMSCNPTILPLGRDGQKSPICCRTFNAP